jgi:hypothetical protein
MAGPVGVEPGKLSFQPVASAAWETFAVPNSFIASFVPFDLVEFSKRERFLIRGLLPSVGLGVVWGPPKCGKSYIVFDWGIHVARGLPYRSQSVNQGLVIYVICEGQSGFMDRIEAYRKVHKLRNAGVPFLVLPTQLDLAADAGQLASDIAYVVSLFREWISCITGRWFAGPALIVIDTLNRTLLGSESSDKDMGLYLAGADRLKSEFQCLVLLVHHCGINRERPRGHTSLEGSSDVDIPVHLKDDVTIAEIRWIKDGRPAGPFYSRLEPVEIGYDDGGEVIDSYVVVEADPPTKDEEENADDLSSDNFPKRVKWMLEALLNELGGAAPHGTWMRKTIEYTAAQGNDKITKATFGLLLRPMKAQGLVTGGGDGQQKRIPYEITEKGRGVVAGTVVWKNGLGWITIKTGDTETVYTDDNQNSLGLVRPLKGGETVDRRTFCGPIKRSETVDCYSPDAGANENAQPTIVEYDPLAEVADRLTANTNRGNKAGEEH